MKEVSESDIYLGIFGNEYGYEDENGKFQRCGSDTSRCLSAASVRQAFASDVIIEGSFTNEEVKTLFYKLFE